MCEDGFEGVLCEIEINECASSPCQNGATCQDKLAQYACACASGYTGLLTISAIDKITKHNITCPRDKIL